MFKHPENRVEVDHAVPSRRTTPCRYGARCTRDNCWFGHDSLGAPGASVCGSAPRVVAPRACAMPAAVSPWQAVVSTVSPTPDGRSGPAEASAIAPGALSGSAAAAGEACGSIEAGAGGASGSSSRLNGNAFAALASDSEDEFEDDSSMWQTTSLRASCGPPRVSHPRGGQGPKRRMQSGRLPSGKSAEWGSGGNCSKWEPVPAVQVPVQLKSPAARASVLEFLTVDEWRQAQQAARHLSGFACAPWLRHVEHGAMD